MNDKRERLAEALLEKLGVTTALYLLKCDRVSVYLNSSHDKAIITEGVPYRRIWKTFRISDNDMSGEDMSVYFQKRGFNTDSETLRILRDKEYPVVTYGDSDLVFVSARALGFATNVKYNDICSRALKLGLEFCTQRDGPKLRMQYRDQEGDENILMAQEILFEGNYTFLLRGSKGLYTYRVKDAVFPPDQIFVFRLYLS